MVQQRRSRGSRRLHQGPALTPLLAAAAATLWAILHALLVVPRLPEPTEAPLPTDEPKPHYASLVTPRNVAWLGIFVFLIAQAAWLAPAAWPLVVVYVGAIGVLVGIDLLTTYLPKRLHYLCAAQLILASLVSGLSWVQLAWGALGALIAGTLFWLVWRFSSAFGFGDVRLATLVGFVAGLGGLNFLVLSIVLATVCGALIGIAWTMIGRRGPFPYGPGLWLGPIVAWVTRLAG